MIEIGDSPEKNSLNKFLTTIDNEGMRGMLLAINSKNDQGVILALNSSFDKQVKWGNMYLVCEENPEQYPKVMKQVKNIPKDFKILFKEMLN